MRLKIIVLGVVVGVGFCLGSCKNSNGKSQNKGDMMLQSVANQGVYEDEWSLPEIEILASPDTASQYVFPKGEEVVDYSVSPTGTFVAVLTEQEGQSELKFWSIGASEISDACSLPKDFKAETVVWHPQAAALFVLGTEKSASTVYRIEKTKREWTVKQIFTSKQKLKNMVVAPQPFVTSYENRKPHYSYRLFLGMDNGNATYRIVSITEYGKRFYQVVGPKKTQTTEIDGEELEFPTGGMISDWALPVAFHPPYAQGRAFHHL